MATPIDPEGPGPTKILFKMYGAHKPQYWQTIRLVAKYKYRDLPHHILRTKHAACAWCPQCDEEIVCVVGNSGVRAHMERYHARELQEYEAARATQTEPQRGTVRPLVPVTPRVSEFRAVEGEQPAAKRPKVLTNEPKRQVNKLVAQWIAVNRRPPALVEDPAFRRLLEVITELGELEVRLPNRTQVRDDVMRIAEEAAGPTRI